MLIPTAICETTEHGVDELKRVVCQMPPREGRNGEEVHHKYAMIFIYTINFDITSPIAPS